MSKNNKMFTCPDCGSVGSVECECAAFKIGAQPPTEPTKHHVHRLHAVVGKCWCETVPTPDQEQGSELFKRDIGSLEFMYDRLVGVYGENPNVDYLIHARRVLDKLSQPTSESKWGACEAHKYMPHPKNSYCVNWFKPSGQDEGEKS